MLTGYVLLRQNFSEAETSVNFILYKIPKSMRKVRGGSIPPAQPWELISLDCLRESRICLLGVGLPNDSQDCFWNYRII